jgi:hypothetical protein
MELDLWLYRFKIPTPIGARLGGWSLSCAWLHDFSVIFLQFDLPCIIMLQEYMCCSFIGSILGAVSHEADSRLVTMLGAHEILRWYLSLSSSWATYACMFIVFNFGFGRPFCTDNPGENECHRGQKLKPFTESSKPPIFATTPSLDGTHNRNPYQRAETNNNECCPVSLPAILGCAHLRDTHRS